MEKCYQCRNEFDGQLAIIAVVPVEGAPEADVAIAVSSAIGANDKEWMAVGICKPCHQAPTVKAHFFFREQMRIALRNAGSADLG